MRIVLHFRLSPSVLWEYGKKRYISIFIPYYLHMKLNFTIEDVIAVVRQASGIMSETDFSVSSKDGYANIVTSCDLAIQSFLEDKLAKLAPGSGFLCEENDEIKDGTDGLTWVIDPIDGTANFSRGIADCCISVALLESGLPRMGVVYSPFKEELFQAERGCGAYRNGKRISVSSRPFEDGLLCTAMSLYDKRYAEVCAKVIFDAYFRCNDVRRFGSCAMELCYLAAGQCDLFFEYRVQAWDYSAAYLILTEAGGVLTGGRGENLSCDTPTMLVGANNGANHAQLLEIVSKYI